MRWLLYAARGVWVHSAARTVRCALLAGLVAVLCLAIAGAAGSALAVARAEHRAAQLAVHNVAQIRDGIVDPYPDRQINPGQTEHPYDLAYRRWIGSTLDARSIALVAVEPASPQVEIPGVPSAATGWFISPGLERYVAANPSYQAAFPQARLLSSDVVRSPDELVALHVVAPGNTFTDATLAVTNAGAGPGIGQVQEDGSSVQTLALIVIVALSLAVLWTALRIVVMSLVAEERILHHLSATPGSITRLRVATASAISIPGVVAGLAAWQRVAGRAESIPVTGESIMAGDLTLSSAHLGVAAAGLIGLVVLAAIAQPTAPDAPSPVPSRPTSLRRLYVFALPALVFIQAVRVGPGSSQSALSVGAALLFAAAMWWCLPVMLGAVGTALVSMGPNRVVLLMAGRRLQRDASASARAIGTLALIALLAPLVAGWFDLNRGAESASERVEEASLGTWTFDLAPAGDAGDAERLATEAGLSVQPLAVTVIMPAPNGAGNGTVPEPIALAVGDCTEWLAGAEHVAECLNGQTLVGTPGPTIDFVDQARIPAENRAPTNYLIRYDTIEQRALVHDWAQITTAQRLVPRARSQVTSDALYGANFATTSEYVDPTYQRNVAWLTALVAATAAAVVVSSLLFVGFHARATGAGRAQLGALGAEWRQARIIALTESFVAVASVPMAGALLGAIAYLGLRMTTPQLPMLSLKLTLLSVASALFVGGLAAVVSYLAVPDPARYWFDRSRTTR